MSVLSQPRIGGARVVIALFASVLLSGGAAAPPANATSATATLSAGSLAFVSAPPAVSFSGTLNGADQALKTTQALDIGDATGSGAGWNLTATSTIFSCCGGTHSLSSAATTVGSAPTVGCDAGATCTPATSGISFPYTLPAGASAPTATKLFDATGGSGMGDQTVTPTWTLSVPADTFAGTYTATWTLSLVSGP